MNHSKRSATATDVSLHSLPDSVLLAILSFHHSPKALAQYATVCSQWRRLCRSVDSLAFSSTELFSSNTQREGNFQVSQKLAAIISQTLLQSRDRPLKQLRIFHSDSFEGVLSLDVWLATWLGSLNPYFLEEVELIFCDDDEWEWEFYPDRKQTQKGLKEIFMRCSKLRRVRLGGWKILEWPLSSAQDSFQQLVCVRLQQIEISDAALEDLVKSCPLLEFLHISASIGFSNPCLVGFNLRVLILCYGSLNEHNLDGLPCVRLIAPKLEKLWATLLDELNFLVRVDALEILRVNASTKIRGVEAFPSLTMLEIWPQPENAIASEMDDARCMIGFGKNVKHLSLDPDVTWGSLGRHPFGFLEFLFRLETLYVGFYLMTALTELDDDFLDSCFQTRQAFLPHLRKVEVDIWDCCPDSAVRVLHGLLVSLGEVVKDLELAVFFEESRFERQVVGKMLHLQKTFPSVQITLPKVPTLKYDETCFRYGK